MPKCSAVPRPDPDAVGVVDEQPSVVLLLERGDLRQLRQVAFHREDAVDHDQLALRVAHAGELALEVLHVVVLVLQ